MTQAKRRITKVDFSSSDTKITLVNKSDVPSESATPLEIDDDLMKQAVKEVYQEQERHQRMAKEVELKRKASLKEQAEKMSKSITANSTTVEVKKTSRLSQAIKKV